MVDDHGKEDGYSLMHQMLTECIIIKLLTNSNDEDDMYIYIPYRYVMLYYFHSFQTNARPAYVHDYVIIYADRHG